MKPLSKKEIAWIKSFMSQKGDVWLRAWRQMLNKENWDDDWR